jgi:AAA family ATP:ADP antiporter
MMLVAAVLLALSVLLTNRIHGREGNDAASLQNDDVLKPVGGFQLVLRRRYLFLIALVILLSNTVATTGEFILGKSVSEYVTDTNQIGVFYADYYFQVNLLSAVLQMFAVSRITRRIGIGPALFVLPILSFGGYLVLSYVPILSFARAIKIVENGASHSIQNTARHALFLCTSREAKYKGKTAIDSFFWRAGDALSALIVFAGTSLAFDVRGFARTNAVLTAAWLCVVAAIVWMRLTRDESHVDQTHPLANDSASA